MKLLLDESESRALLTHLSSRARWISSSLLIVELRCATSHLGHDVLPRERVERLLNRCGLATLDERVLDRAAEPFRPPQRALDAIHLATAISLDLPGLEFCSYDASQLEAARAAGLDCVSPRPRSA